MQSHGKQEKPVNLDTYGSTYINTAAVAYLGIGNALQLKVSALWSCTEKSGGGLPNGNVVIQYTAFKITLFLQNPYQVFVVYSIATTSF